MDGSNIQGDDNLGYGNHQADDATAAYEQTKSLALRNNAERLLKEVEEALRRFERGEYGVCGRCHQEIDPARLKAIPQARYCMTCQTDIERNVR